MKDRRRGDFFQEAVVGLFMLAVFALLGYFTIIISGVDVFGGGKKTAISLTFPDAGGLKRHDNVIYRGTKVGSVREIELHDGGVTVTAEISDDVVMRSGYVASIESLSLLGGNYLLLEEGKGDPLPLEGTVFKGRPPADWMREIGSIARNINEITGDGSIRSIVTNFQGVAERANAVMARIERGEGSIGKLLSTNDQLYVDLASTLSDASKIAGRLERGESTLGKLLSTNDQLYADLASTVSDASAIARRLEKGEGTLGRLLSSDDTVYADLARTMANAAKISDRLERGEGTLGGLLSTNDAMFASLRRTVDNLETVTGRMAAGEGTLGKLSKESQLYDDASALLIDARQVLDNYRDTTPISTFGSLILGGL